MPKPVIACVRIRCAALAAMLLALLPPAQAGAQATTGRVMGSVSSSAGEAVDGSTVVMRNVETGMTRSTRTRADGGFTIALLPPGPYSIRATAIGFQPSSDVMVLITAGATRIINLQLRAGPVELSAVHITAGAADATPGLARHVSRAEIENLPSLGRDFSDFIALSGSVAPSPEITTGGRFAIAGQRPSQTTLQIDGANANNAFFSDNRGGSRIPFTFPLESIREFQVITATYDVEHSRAMGGVVNVVTRSGTNDREGTVFANARGSGFTGQYFTPVAVLGDTLRRPRGYEVFQYGTRLSGPLIRDRVHYLVAVDGQRRREPFTPLSPERLLQRGDTASHDAMNRFISILESRYGVADARDTFRTFLVSNDVVAAFGRVDAEITRSHRLSLRHNTASYENGNEAAIEAVSGGLSAVERLRNVSHSLVSEVQSVLGERTYNLLRFQYSSEARPRTAAEQRPELQVVLPGGDVVRYGGNHIAFQNRSTERKLQLVNNLTHQLGDHSVKLGGGLITTRIRVQFLGPQGAGIYRFANLDDMEQYRPESYVRRVPTSGEIPRYRMRVLEWALYAQDEWQINQRMRATVGLRYDVQQLLDSPESVPAIESAFGFPTGALLRDRNNLSPRVSLTYDLAGDGRTIVRAGMGLFHGSIPLTLGGIAALPEPVLSLACRGSISAGAPDAPPTPEGYALWDRVSAGDNPAACAGGVGPGGVPEYNFWDPGFELPKTFSASAGWEHQLFSNTRIRFDAVHSRTTRLYTVRDLNLREAQFTLTGEGGRRVYTPMQAFNPASAAGRTGHRQFPAFASVLVATSEGSAEASLLTTEIGHVPGSGMLLRASYTYSRAYDNSSFSCCLLSAGFASPRVGAFGPNELGGRGDLTRAWGPSDYNRPHSLVFSALRELPRGFRVSALWRTSSGTPWGPELSGDPNGDGINFNDRPFIFAPEQLPLDPTLPPEQQQQHRDRYAGYLSRHPCVGAYIAEIVPRNSCRNPRYSRLDAALGYSFPTFGGRRVDLTLDVFNVLNLLNRNWGRYTGVTMARRLLLEPRTFAVDAGGTSGTIRYRVPTGFSEDRELGTNLLLQWQLQFAARYGF
jgi:hypothetical protein